MGLVKKKRVQLCSGPCHTAGHSSGGNFQYGCGLCIGIALHTDQCQSGMVFLRKRIERISQIKHRGYGITGIDTPH